MVLAQVEGRVLNTLSITLVKAFEHQHHHFRLPEQDM